MKVKKITQIFLFFVIYFLLFSVVTVMAVNLEKVEVRQIGEKTRVVLSLDDTTSHQSSLLQAPLRVIVNFSEKITTTDASSQDFMDGSVKTVRFITLKSSAAKASGVDIVDAVVLELKEGSAYEVYDQDNEVLIDVSQKGNSSEEPLGSDLDILLESAKENFNGEFFLLAKADCENILAIDNDNKAAKKMLRKIDKQMYKNEKDAAELAEVIASDKSQILEGQKADAAELAEALADEDAKTEMEEDSFKDLVKKGKVLYKRKRYEEAIEFWNQALQIKSSEKVINLIEKANNKIIERRSKTSGTSALDDYEVDQVAGLLAQGEEEFANLDYAFAIGTFEQVLAIDPNNLRAMRYIARARKNQREYVATGGKAEDVILSPDIIGADYGVFSLENAVKVGLANHLSSKVAQEEVVLAKLKTKEAKRALFPKVKLKYKTTEGTTTGEDFEGEEYGAEFQQNIYAGGKYKTLYNQARVNLAVARKNYEKTKASFIFEVIQAYYNMAFAKSKMKNKLQLVKKIEDLLSTAEKQYTAKALTLAEVLEARNQKAEVSFQTQQIQNDLDLAALALRQLLSLPEDSNFDVIEIPEPIVFDLDPKQLVEIGYANRRDYQVKKLLVLFKKYGLEIAKNKRAFNVELTGSYGQRDEYYVSEQVDLKDEYYIGLKVSKPLGPHIFEFNGVTQDKVPQVGQTTSTEFESAEVAVKLWEQKSNTSVAEANIAYHKAISELENSKRTLVHDIHSAMYSVREAEAKMKNKKSSVTMITEELRSTRAKSKVEQATIVQVMRTETKLWNSKTDYVSAQADYYVSIAKLNKHMGVNDYFDPSAGVKSVDKEGLNPGIRLLVRDQVQEKKWYNLSSFDGGVASYYPDDVVTDILKEKQDENVMGKGKFLGIFKKKEDELDKYKSYDEKYDFQTPEKKKKWYNFFSKGKYDDDFSGFYQSNKEYDEAFSAEESAASVSLEEDKLQRFEANSEEETQDYFETFLMDVSRKVFTQYHVEENQYETVIAIRTNSKILSSVSVLKGPDRLLISFKDVVISALSDYESVNKGNVISLKAFHTKTVLPSKFQNWKRILSLIVELDEEKDYTIESSDNIFKIIIKK